MNRFADIVYNVVVSAVIVILGLAFLHGMWSGIERHQRNVHAEKAACIKKATTWRGARNCQ